MSELVITNIDAVNIHIECDKSTAKELSDFFTFKVPGHEYMPAFRNKLWDGQIKLYNIYKQTIYQLQVVVLLKHTNIKSKQSPTLSIMIGVFFYLRQDLVRV